MTDIDPTRPFERVGTTNHDIADTGTARDGDAETAPDTGTARDGDADHSTTTETLADYAAAYSVDEATLEDALTAVQTVMAPLDTADIVFEYRRAFERDPLVARHGDAYYLAVPPRVWPEFASVLDFAEPVVAACQAVHADCFRNVVGATADDREPLVLVGGTPHS